VLDPLPKFGRLTANADLTCRRFNTTNDQMPIGSAISHTGPQGSNDKMLAVVAHPCERRFIMRKAPMMITMPDTNPDNVAITAGMIKMAHIMI
jgi:hypothetical protein